MIKCSKKHIRECMREGEDVKTHIVFFHAPILGINSEGIFEKFDIGIEETAEEKNNTAENVIKFQEHLKFSKDKPYSDYHWTSYFYMRSNIENDREAFVTAYKFERVLILFLLIMNTVSLFIIMKMKNK